jgi:hypothetical protein
MYWQKRRTVYDMYTVWVWNYGWWYSTIWIPIAWYLILSGLNYEIFENTEKDQRQDLQFSALACCNNSSTIFSIPPCWWKLIVDPIQPRPITQHNYLEEVAWSHLLSRTSHGKASLKGTQNMSLAPFFLKFAWG